MKERRDASTYVAIGLGVVALLVAGGAIGYVINDGSSDSDAASENVRPSDLGNAVAGRQIYTSAGCVACHSYAGVGGEDAPPLDFMRGKLAVAELAAMSGRIWNHVPRMQKLFKEEGIPFPQFTGSEMADLMAYLHGGGEPPVPRQE